MTGKMLCNSELFHSTAQRDGLFPQPINWASSCFPGLMIFLHKAIIKQPPWWDTSRSSDQPSIMAPRCMCFLAVPHKLLSSIIKYSQWQVNSPVISSIWLLAEPRCVTGTASLGWLHNHPPVHLPAMIELWMSHRHSCKNIPCINDL